MLILGFNRGLLRARSWVLTLILGGAMWVLIGLPGLGLALVVLLHGLWRQPPRSGVWLISAEDMRSPLWLDEHSVVLGKPYRVIYRDEVAPALFCRLRRRCYGLPT